MKVKNKKTTKKVVVKPKMYEITLTIVTPGKFTPFPTYDLQSPGCIDYLGDYSSDADFDPRVNGMKVKSIPVTDEVKKWWAACLADDE